MYNTFKTTGFLMLCKVRDGKMSKEKNQSKIDITSTVLEKGVDVAKGFIDRLVSPSVEEFGLLIKDQISLLRFNNQVRILNKAKAICEKNNVSVKSIPLKLLCPYLEHASLEDDDEFQEKWAILLVNMVDSQQNIQNHVFPYILSQLSKDEFRLLESVFIEKERRVSVLEDELSEFLRNRPTIEALLQSEIDEMKRKKQSMLTDGQLVYSGNVRKISSSVRAKELELHSLNFEESRLRRLIASSEKIPEKSLKKFEIANIIRLGLANVVYEVSAGTHSIEIPTDHRDSSYTSVDFDIDVDTDTSMILTELGEFFINACREKNV